MNRKGLAYILFVLFILIAILLYVLRDEYFQTQQAETQSNVQIEDVVSLGTEVLREYRINSSAITKGTYKIEIYNKRGNVIAYKTYEELEDIIYPGQRYDGQKIIDEEKTVVRYSLQSYANLVSALESSVTGYNEEKLKLYYEDEKVVIDNTAALNNGGIDTTLPQSNTSSSSNANTNTSANINTTPNRQLGANEVYGTNVIVDFRSHQADIVAGRKYFRVVIEGTTTAYTRLEDLTSDIDTSDIYLKQFELDNAGNLRGYTFTRVD